MATKVFKNHHYPSGTTVDAYAYEAAWPFVCKGQIPPATKAESPTTASDQSTTFTGLTAGKLYYLAATVGGVNKFVLVQG